MENIENKIEMFFDYDMRIKRIIAKLTYDLNFVYSDEHLFDYEKQMKNALEEIKYYLYCMTDKFRPYAIKKFESFFDTIEEAFEKACGDHRAIGNFHDTFIANMREEFVKDVGKSYEGYAFFSGPGQIAPSSINEYLHDLHSAVLNSEYTFLNSTVIENEALNDSFVILRGRDNPIATALAVTISNLNIPTDQIDVLSLSNKILLMIRDLGHATTVEIRFESGMALVDYFIPKITNYEMVNELPGLSFKATPETKYVRGKFEVPEQELPLRMGEFIEKIPGDNAYSNPEQFDCEENKKHIA